MRSEGSDSRGWRNAKSTSLKRRACRSTTIASEVEGCGRVVACEKLAACNGQSVCVGIQTTANVEATRPAMT
eukprot:scaffold527148_cov23-Prasinocladus_malaysianus.AAC.1